MAWNKITQEQYKRPADGYETDLTDAEWSVIELLIPPPSKMGRPRTLNMRKVVNAIQFMLGTGCRRRAVPKCFSPFTSIQNSFHAWMSRCRRLAKDHERSLESSAAWAQLAACRFLMRRVAREISA